MSEPAFVYETTIATTPERLWAALTSGELTRRYWFDRRIESDWTPGSRVLFYDGDTDVVTDTGVVLECEPPRRLVYRFRNELEGEGAADRPFTRVAFDIEPLEGGRVRCGWSTTSSSTQTTWRGGARAGHRSWPASRRSWRAGRR